MPPTKRILKIFGGLGCAAVALWLITYCGEPMSGEQLIRYQIERARNEVALKAYREEIERNRACDHRSWGSVLWGKTNAQTPPRRRGPASPS